MKINPNTKLIHRDVFLYDIESCHYTIMKNLDFDMSNIDETNKTERNIQIGKMMRRNPKLTSLLRTTTESIMNEYIHRNNIQEDDILLRQYDGIITTKRLSETNINTIPLNIRKHFYIFISSVDRKKYIALTDEDDVSVKGVAFRYEAMNKIYKQLCKINYANKDSIFRNLQLIKDRFMQSNDARLFGIPSGDGKANILLKGYGEMEISERTLKIIDTDDIDKERYFEMYVTPFTKSIVIEHIR